MALNKYSHLPENLKIEGLLDFGGGKIALMPTNPICYVDPPTKAIRFKDEISDRWVEIGVKPGYLCVRSGTQSGYAAWKLLECLPVDQFGTKNSLARHFKKYGTAIWYQKRDYKHDFGW